MLWLDDDMVPDFLVLSFCLFLLVVCVKGVV